MKYDYNYPLLIIAVKLGLCFGLEFLVFSLHFAMYVQTIESLPIDLYLPLSELPLVGVVFSLTKELTLAHLLSVVLAAASVSVPLLIWYETLKKNVLDCFETYFSSVKKIVFGCVAVIMYIVLISLEFITIYVRINENSTMAFSSVDPSHAANYFSIFLAIVFIITNAGMALITANIYINLIKLVGEYDNENS